MFPQDPSDINAIDASGITRLHKAAFVRYCSVLTYVYRGRGMGWDGGS
jgi:hypothetical protein